MLGVPEFRAAWRVSSGRLRVVPCEVDFASTTHRISGNDYLRAALVVPRNREK